MFAFTQNSMPDYQFKFEKGSKKYACPKCGAPKKFRRYINRRTGEYAGVDFGRCDRENSCGYHRYPSTEQSFAGNSAFFGLKRRVFQETTFKNAASSFQSPVTMAKMPDYIAFDVLIRTLTSNEPNAFVQFLFDLFPDDPDAVCGAIAAYGIGTFKNFTAFPKIDRSGRVATAKLMKFDRRSGKRLRENYSVSSLPYELKRTGELKQDFETDKDVFFGEHLLSKFPNLPVAIVEAEKTAVIAFICKSAFPDFVWLATGSKQWLNVNRLKQLGKRRIILYPDADGFNHWRKIEAEARASGLNVMMSDIIEKQATSAQKAQQLDLADYLVHIQRQINEKNSFIDKYNEKVEAILKKDSLYRRFNSIVEKQKTKLVTDCGLTAEEAEMRILQPGNFRNIVLILEKYKEL